MKLLELLRILPLFIGLLLSLAVYSPGYCLDPPVITPIEEFFIEHNGGPVQIAPPDWQLIVDGLVEFPLVLTIEEILEYPSQTQMATIECGGNPFAFKVADLIGNALWTGVPVSTILNQATPLDNATSVIFTALDGYKVTLDIETIYARDDIMLAHGMNGETLPPEQGYPLRLTIPGMLGALWAQWVTHIEISSEESPGPRAPLPAHCQIFEPAHEQTINLDAQRIYGMALAGDNEIVAVEVSTDGGFSWQPATILTEYVPNAWRHWEFSWTPPAPGDYMLSARAIDTAGTVQGEIGIYGWNMLSIEISAETNAECEMAIKHKKIIAEKLFKPKKRTFKITGGDNFDPYGTIDLGPLEVLNTKIATKKNILKIKALVPDGLEPQIIPVRIGECFGEIEIL